MDILHLKPPKGGDVEQLTLQKMGGEMNRTNTLRKSNGRRLKMGELPGKSQKSN